MLTIAKFIAGLLNVDLQKVQRILFWVVVLFAGVVLLFLVLQIRSCFNRPPKLDEAEIQAGEQAVKERNDKELRQILTNSDVREAQIEANVTNAKAEAVNARHESEKKWANANISDLQAEFDRRMNQ